MPSECQASILVRGYLLFFKCTSPTSTIGKNEPLLKGISKCPLLVQTGGIALLCAPLQPLMRQPQVDLRPRCPPTPGIPLMSFSLSDSDPIAQRAQPYILQT